MGTRYTVNVSATKSDNSVVIGGLEYGYYLVDEVSDVEGTHSAASLCIVNTANPTADVNIKSDYPSVIKKIQEDDNQDSIGNNGWNDIADYEIGQTVPYKYESNIRERWYGKDPMKQDGLVLLPIRFSKGNLN